MRKARLATTSILLNDNNIHPGLMIERGLTAIKQAAQWKPDLIVLPEELDLMDSAYSSGKGEEIPGGQLFGMFADAAHKADSNLVIGMRELSDGRTYNIGAVIDRHGKFIGKYSKTHLAPSEDESTTAGDDYPVFELDFGRVGIMICMDVHYPEPWTILALQGADVIAHPTMWRDYTGDMLESIVNARAIDNQVYVVTSHYIQTPFLTGNSQGHARVIDPYGRTLADTSHKPGVCCAEVDLDQCAEYWATGELKRNYPTLKECFLGMRRPETYKILTRPDSENSWKIQNPTLSE